jgi:toxin FitB
VSLVVVDTDVASLSLRNRLPDPLRARLTGLTWCVSFVTVGELTKWTRLRDWGPSRLQAVAAWLDRVWVIPFDRSVAVRWGELQAAGQRRGQSKPVNDTWIAACCWVEGLSLASLNAKDFADFSVHHGLVLV